MDRRLGASVLEREPMVREAISSAFEELEAEQPRREAELSRIDAEAKRVGESLDRYFRAFEELGAETPEEHEPLSDEDLELLVAHVREVIAGGHPPTRKALLQSLVEEIRVVSRAETYPSFLLPAVRPPGGSVPPAGIEPASRA